MRRVCAVHACMCAFLSFGRTVGSTGRGAWFARGGGTSGFYDHDFYSRTHLLIELMWIW